MSETNHIIQYTADIEGILSKLKELQRLNTVAASQMTTDFTRAVDIIEQKFSKISQSTIKVPELDSKGVATGKLKDQVTIVEQLTSTVKNSVGGFEKFVETTTKVDGAIKKSTISLAALKAPLDKPATVFLGSLQQITTQLSNLDRVTNQVKSTFGANAGVTSVGTPKLTSTKTQTTIIDGNAVAQQTQTFNTSVKLADGTSKNLRDTLVSVNGQVTKTSSVFAEASASSLSFADNLKRLVSRAALTIPIWFALRSSILSVFNGIKDGLSNFITFDTALQKLKLNITGTPAEIEAGFNRAKATITDFSRQTGISTEEITKAVEKFATIGFSIDDALQGGIESTKLAVVLFGNATEVATAYARAIKIFSENTKEATNVQQQMAEAFALTAQLQATNQFDINEVTESLIKFAPVAKQAGLSLKETLVTLAALGTAGITGSNAGSLLSTSINELRNNATKLKNVFDIDVKPLDSTFSILQKIVNKSEELGKKDQLGSAQATALSEIFGGQKGIKVVSALTAMNKVLKDNANIIVDVNFLEAKFEKTQDTLGNNVRRLVNDLKENGKAFINAAVGGDDFNQSIKNIDSGVNGLGKALVFLGVVLNSIGALLPVIIGAGAITVALQTAARVGALASVADFFAGGALLGGALVTGFSSILPALIPATIVALIVAAKAIPDLIKNAINEGSTKEGLNIDKIIQGLRGQLSNQDLGNVIFKIKKGEIRLPKNLNVDQVVKNLQDQLNKQVLFISPKIQTAPTSFTPEQNTKIDEAIVQNQLDKLRSEGATTAELLKQEIILKKLFGLYTDPIDPLKDQLKLQQAITNEQKLQSKFGSDTVKLFDLAQKGVDTHTLEQVGGVIQGKIPVSQINTLSPEAQQILKDDFADLLKQQFIAASVLGQQISGQNILPDLSRVPIQEQVAQNPALLNLTPDQIKLQTEQLKNIQATINSSINADIKVTVEGLSFQDAIIKLKEELIKDLQNPESKIGKATGQFVEGV